MLANWVTVHATMLNIIAYGLGGLAFVFGAKGLGRFPAMTKAGGFYSAILAMLVILAYSVFIYAVSYGIDLAASNKLTQLISQTLHWPPNPPLYVLVFSVSTALWPGLILATSSALRRGDMAAFYTEEKPLYSRFGSLGRVLSITSFALDCGSLLVMCFVAVVFSTYYAFVVLGWFGGQSPPLLVVLAMTGLLALVIGFLGLVIVVTTEDMIKRQVTATTDPSVRPLNLDDRLELLGCQIPLIVIALCLTVCSALSIFSLVHGNGWVVLAFVAAVLGNFIAPRGIAFLSNRLSRRGLLTIFGIPGVLAAALGFVANFPDLLRILPW